MPMKVLLVHNYYQQPGGEDQVFADEARLLESRGHEVLRLTVHNDAIATMGRLALAVNTLWNRRTYRQVRDYVATEQPAVVHFHNTFPLISPAAYYAARAQGAAVVHTLHNYRHLCANALMFRDGHNCEECVGAGPSRAVQHRCYRGSRAATAVVAGLLAGHRAIGTWRRAVDHYITLTEFARGKFIAGGLPAERISVKPNFVNPDPGPGDGAGGFVLFVGRLTPEKGVETLLRAWQRLPGSVQLRIAGGGPLVSRVQAAAAADPRIEYVGQLPASEVHALMGQAACLMFPSLWYEGLPKTIVESFAKGTPVIASRLGAMADLIDDHRTGLHFTPGDADDLARVVQSALANPAQLAAMRMAARREFLQYYGSEANYGLLIRAYEAAIAQAQRSRVSLQANRQVTSAPSQPQLGLASPGVGAGSTARTVA